MLAGKFAVWGVAETISAPKTPVPQRLLKYFPGGLTGKTFSTNREFIRRIRELKPAIAAPSRMSAYPPDCVKTALDDMILLRFGRRIR
jgi:hypothetical protein